MGNANFRDGVPNQIGVAQTKASAAAADVVSHLVPAPPFSTPHANVVPVQHQLPVAHRVSGNPHDGVAGRVDHAGSVESMGHTPPDSPGSSSRSPLGFTPQIPMVPISRPDEAGFGPWTYDSQGYIENEQDPGIPTLIQWTYGANEVFIEGSWDNWSTRIPLQRAGKDFSLVMLLRSGVYQYKFIVNGEWTYAPELPWMYDEMGSVNNVLDVQDYVPENLESIAGFEPPRSPDASYDNMFPGPEDFGKEPPLVPSHLHLTLLNVPSNTDAPGALLRPQHVILNHLYVEKGKPAHSLLSLGFSHRFRSKYVTVVLYKPLRK